MLYTLVYLLLLRIISFFCLLLPNFNLLTHNNPHLASTEELSKIAEKGNETAQKLLERSASLIACQIAGIYRYKCRERFQTVPYQFIMEGSLFWQGWKYKAMVEIPKK